ncbi:unnamed protein product [Fraxinus pennsylvanica]|uniref:Uncharacterized protein n=1 Tax=Fraxinus pennsylvanica TaxID=56036 RepID=A0AAD2EGT4_9LAMI|nr:unnamed protein product [Fraxinus pennsylvanica]
MRALDILELGLSLEITPVLYLQPNREQSWNNSLKFLKYNKLERQSRKLKAMDDGIQERLLGSEGKEVSDLKGKVYDESKKIWRVALPGIIARVASFGTIIVTQSFIGHINSLDLAGYALVQTLSVRFINGILIGMSSATETLCGQAYGARQYHMMGI